MKIVNSILGFLLLTSLANAQTVPDLEQIKAQMSEMRAKLSALRGEEQACIDNLADKTDKEALKACHEQFKAANQEIRAKANEGFQGLPPPPTMGQNRQLPSREEMKEKMEAAKLCHQQATTKEEHDTCRDQVMAQHVPNNVAKE